MSNLFESKEEIQKNEFLKNWRESEDGTDQFALDNLGQHEDYKGLKYYVVTLAEHRLNNLIIPHHNHVNNEVAVGGEPFWDVVSKYSKRFKVQKGGFDDCLQRVCRAMKLIDQSIKLENLLGAKFMFISNGRELAMPGDVHYKDHSKNKLYAGNFHRFIAYGLWIKENGYQPIKVYYCERI